MAINYPTSLDDTTSLPTRTTGDTIPVFDTNDPKSAIIQLETKLGTGASTPTTSGHVLRVTGAGATAYGAVAQADVTNLTTDLAAKVPTTRTVNSHALSADISLTASDVGAVPTTRTVNGHALSADISVTANDILPTQTGNSGKFLTTDGTSSSWGTPAGGGGQTLYDIIVDASGGGDYTTLGAAVAAASAGDTIFVKSGTYNETVFTTTLANLTIIGENSAATILQWASGQMQFNGSNTCLYNLGFNITSGAALGRLWIGGPNSRLVGCNITSASLLLIILGGTNTLVENCIFTDTGSYDDYKIKLVANEIRFVNNQCYLNPTSTDKISCLQIDSPRGVCTGNLIKRNTQGTGTLVYIHSNKLNTFSGNTIVDVDNQCDLVSAGDILVNITGNVFQGGVKAVKSDMPDIVVVGNSFFQCLQGVYLTESNCLISGNQIYGPTTTATSGQDGITITSGMSNTIITGNRIQNFYKGINIVDSTCTKNIVTSNNLLGNVSAALIDNGTGTINANNITA